MFIIQNTKTKKFLASFTPTLGATWTARQDWAETFPQWRAERFLAKLNNCEIIKIK